MFITSMLGPGSLQPWLFVLHPQGGRLGWLGWQSWEETKNDGWALLVRGLERCRPRDSKLDSLFKLLWA